MTYLTAHLVAVAVLTVAAGALYALMASWGRDVAAAAERPGTLRRAEYRRRRRVRTVSTDLALHYASVVGKAYLDWSAWERSPVHAGRSPLALTAEAVPC
jgi:hypothetical protein